jgi:integrase
MESVTLLDRAGRRRSPATTSCFHRGVSPRNKGIRYPPDPPTVEEIIAAMRAAGDGPDGVRLRGVIVVLWRAGLRINEALSLTETDLEEQRRIGFGQAWQERSPSPGRDGRVGMDGARTVAGRARRVAGRPVVLRDRRTHRQARLVSQRRQAPATPGRA